jgi:hypothetical protein
LEHRLPNKKPGRRIQRMKYLFAWMLGVPGVVIVIWFLMNHH